MRKQVVHISIHQTSKVVAAMHTVMITLLFILPNVLALLYNRHLLTGIFLLLFMPLFVWALLYIGYIVACWFYNLVVPYTGGIEIDVADVTSAEPLLAANKNLIEEENPSL
jgi:hypothetical protein